MLCCLIQGFAWVGPLMGVVLAGGVCLADSRDEAIEAWKKGALLPGIIGCSPTC